MTIDVTPAELAELLERLLRLIGLLFPCRRAVSVSLALTSKGQTMNPITVGPGAKITGTVTGKDANGLEAVVKAPVAWSTDNGVAGVTVTPSADTLSAVIQLPAGVTTGALKITVTTADNLTASGTVNVAEGAAVSISLDFSVAA